MATLGFGMMSFEMDGERVLLDVATVKSTEWKAIKAYCGKRPFEVLTEIDDPECLDAIYWLVAKRAGREFPIGTEDFDSLAFLASIEEVKENEAPKGSPSRNAKRKNSSSNA